MNIVWLVLGFIGGVIVSRNAEPMTAPETAAVFAAMFAACGIAWTCAYHGKRQAVASAVATATATAVAQARSEAAAAAQAVVNLYGMSDVHSNAVVPGQRAVVDSDVSESITQGEQHAQRDRSPQVRSVYRR